VDGLIVITLSGVHRVYPNRDKKGKARCGARKAAEHCRPPVR